MHCTSAGLLAPFAFLVICPHALGRLSCATLWKACAKHMTTMAYCCALSACAWKRRFSNCSTPAPRNSTHKEQHRTFPKPREHASTTRAAHQLHTPLDTLPPLSTTPASHRHATSNTPSRQLANLAKRGVSRSWLAESMAKPHVLRMPLAENSAKHKVWRTPLAENVAERAAWPACKLHADPVHACRFTAERDAPATHIRQTPHFTMFSAMMFWWSRRARNVKFRDALCAPPLPNTRVVQFLLLPGLLLGDTRCALRLRLARALPVLGARCLAGCESSLGGCASSRLDRVLQAPRSPWWLAGSPCASAELLALSFLRIW